MDEKRFAKLRAEVEELQAEANRAEGVLKELKKQLWKDFKVSTIKEARKLLSKLEREQEEAEAEFEEEMDKFEEAMNSPAKRDAFFEDLLKRQKRNAKKLMKDKS